MKYIVLGIPTYPSERILSILATVYNQAGLYHVVGSKDSAVLDVIALKKFIKEASYNVYHITAYPGNAIPMFNAVPPGDFEYRICQIDYDLTDFILYKTIEMISKDIISVQTINNFILNNNTTIAAWKEQHDLANRTGEYDLVSVTRINAAQCLDDPVEYLNQTLGISKKSLESAVKANNSSTNPGYVNKFNINEHYYSSLKDVMLSDPTLSHILKL